MAFNGWSYEGGTEYLPLYEAKMLGHFDHRFSTYQERNPGTVERGLTATTYIETARRPATWSLSPDTGSPSQR